MCFEELAVKLGSLKMELMNTGRKWGNNLCDVVYIEWCINAGPQKAIRT
jgi:hypothetical protein